MLEGHLKLEVRWQYSIRVSAFSPGFVVLSNWNNGVRGMLSYSLARSLANGQSVKTSEMC